MPYVHQFGIVGDIEEFNSGSVEYNPKKYNCMSVDGDFIDYIYHRGFGDKIKKMPTFINNVNEKYYDLSYYGNTLIPPSSLDLFLSIIQEENNTYHSKQLIKLCEKIIEAKKENKWVIHFGI